MARFRVLTLLAATATTGLLVTPMAYAADGPGHGRHHRRDVTASAGPLRDLQTADDGAFDHAYAAVTMTTSKRSGSSIFTLQIRGIDRSVAGQRFGAHLHTGPCVAGNGAAAGPHYNTDVLAGVVPPVVSPDTEVWLDFGVRGRGTARSKARVPFIPADGQRAIVVHAMSTNPDDGMAGARLACLPFRIR